MVKRILSASLEEDMVFEPGVNILQGPGATEKILTLAGIFGGIPPKNGKAEILWDTVRLAVSVADGTCTVDRAEGENIPQIVKDFHKQRFLHFRNREHILYEIPENLKELQDDRPLFVLDFDVKEEPQTFFAPLIAAGRQVFVEVPKNNMEG